MADLLEMYGQASPGSDMFKRITSAFIKASWDVMNEVDTTPNHIARLSLAEGIVTNPNVVPQKHFRRVMANTTLQTGGDASTDSEIQFVVNSVFGIIAGD